VLEALPYAIEGGLRVPLVYNTSAYDSLHGLRLMEDVVDIYMPDFKYWDPHKCARFLRAKDYAQRAREAITEMHRQVGPLEIDDNGLARRGVLVRHLVMPGGHEDTAAILHWLADEIDPRTYVNVMAQYHPAGLVTRRPDKYPTLQRRPSIDELARARELASDLGLRLDDRKSLGIRLLWR
jgi:putative pyruvate formate lyase activating enzyme